ncbi:MAG: ATP-binding protein [Dehalococcoidia bacterium]|nr:ATP-binding protein [Dehalococcoidia bacterium]
MGMVIGGSLEAGVEVKLAPTASVEDVKVGTFMTLAGERSRFMGLVTDVQLRATDPAFAAVTPDPDDTLSAQVMAGTTAYAVVKVRPQIVLPEIAGDVKPGEDVELSPAKTIPAHFSRAFTASETDIGIVFGKEDARHFYVGNPLDLEAKVCLDMQRFVERSSGVFGKSGTGKSFLTRLVLIGMAQKTSAVSLVFDMHSEYGWSGQDTDRSRQVKGLKQLFPSRVAVFTLDEESTRRKGITPDGVVRIGYDQVEPEDIQLLAETLNLTPNAVQAAYRLPRYNGWGKQWLEKFLEVEPPQLQDIAIQLSESPMTIEALHRRLERLKRLPFIGTFPDEQAIHGILDSLKRGRHVVLEFGRYRNSLDAYILVASVLTRRIHDHWTQQVEHAQGDSAKEPPPLVIVIEEAHKFLSPDVASQTTFGTIARELRKYKVTLLVIDQRPGSIDSEVMSQIGTKIVCLLDNEKDIDAALSGVAGARALREVLARMESKQQALFLGHALPMPVVVRIREYGSEDSYRQLLQPTTARRKDGGDELFG